MARLEIAFSPEARSGLRWRGDSGEPTAFVLKALAVTCNGRGAGTSAHANLEVVEY